MKSLGVVALGLVCVALFVFAIKNVLSTAQRWESWELDTTRLFTAIEVERIVRDSTQTILRRMDSMVSVEQGVANRHSVQRTTALREADSLKALLDGSVSERDSLLYALERAERLEGALGGAQGEIVSLRSIVAAQGLSLSRLKLSEQQAWTLLDSASAVIRRVPKACRVPLIGLPCPVPTVGIGLTADGIRAYVGVGFPLRQH